MTPRAGALNASEIGALKSTLARAAASPDNQYIGPATPPPARVGLPLPLQAGSKSAGRAQLLPPALAPVRLASGKFSVPLPVPEGAFGSRAKAPIQRLNPLKPLTVGKIFLAGALLVHRPHGARPARRRQDAPADGRRRVRRPRRLLHERAGEGGPTAFLQGAGATFAGYVLAGALSFGLLEVFSRGITTLAGEGNALFFSAPLLTISSIFSTTICATAVCPFEAVRILSVRSGATSSGKRSSSRSSLRAICRSSAGSPPSCSKRSRLSSPNSSSSTR